MTITRHNAYMYICTTWHVFLWTVTYLCPYHNVLPEAICCCLQICKFVLSVTLMNNVHVQTFNFIRANMCKFVPYFMSLS